MPNYNDANYIGTALQAICEQSFLPVEVIVVDDGSTDNSIEVINQLISKYSMIRLIKNETNQGINYSVNRGAAASKGELIYFPSANDRILPGFFEKSVHLLDKYPQAGLCCTDWTIEKSGKIYEQNHWLNTSRPEYLSPKQVASSKWKTPFPCGANSIFRRSLINEEQIYPLDLEYYADWFLVQAMIFRYGCCYIPESLVTVQWLADGHFNRMLANDSHYNEVCGKIFQTLALPKYADITPLSLRSRTPQLLLKLSARTPQAVRQSLQAIKSPQARLLSYYLILDYIFTMAHSSIYMPTINMAQPIVQSIKNIFIGTGHAIKNLWDRSFATSFHHYANTRSIIKKWKLNIVDKLK